MKSLVVTGGAGFIGSNFVRLALARTAAHVTVVDKLTYAGNLASLADVSSNPRYAFIQADIADEAAMKKLFKEKKPDGIVNFAAETHVDRSIDGPRAFIDANLIGVFSLLEAFRELCADKNLDRRFVQISTDEVYGSLGATGAFSETTPYAPNSPYSASKAGADHLVRAYHETYGLPTLITNCSNNYGPYQYPEKLIPLMVLNALEAKNLPIYGDGGNVRDWLYVDDHCEAILAVLQRGKPGEKYNVGGNNERSNVQIVSTICSILEKESPAPANAVLRARNLTSYEGLKTFVPDRPGHDRRYAIDSSKIQRELGWTPRHNLESGLRETVRWYMTNRAWCQNVQSGKYGRQRLGLSSEGK
jgi:dTDP-glucose 4,6-dehydratase